MRGYSGATALIRISENAHRLGASTDHSQDRLGVGEIVKKTHTNKALSTGVSAPSSALPKGKECTRVVNLLDEFECSFSRSSEKYFLRHAASTLCPRLPPDVWGKDLKQLVASLLVLKA